MATVLRQIVSYAAIGIASNAAGYLAYLLVTWLWLPPKLAMTLLYVVGASVGFLGNRRFTFRRSGAATAPAIRFALAHVGGYGLNLAILVVFVDRMGLPHQLVQGAAIFCVAAYLFVALKLFVFPAEKGVADG